MAAPAILGKEFPREVRAEAGNPIYNHYRCKDDKWLALAHLQPDRYWPNVCRALGMQELEKNTKFNSIEARGEKTLEEVVVGKLDINGELIKGTEKVYQTDALVVGYGFVPNIEAPQLAGCALEYAREKGGWIVSVSDRMETSADGILAAGEITGVGGAQKSLTEGKIAAYTILEKLGVEDGKKLAPLFKKLTKERKHHLSFVKCFNSLYGINPKTILEIPDDTIICRCENIDMKSIKDGIQTNKSCCDPNSLKVSTRCAMGQCQGRICGPIIYDLLHVLCNKSPEEIGLFSVRPPLKPVSIKALKSI